MLGHSLAERARQYQWVRDHLGEIGCRNIDVVALGNDWLDDAGFSFYGGEFV